MPEEAPATDGILLIDKPNGFTSHDAVARVRRALGIRKVGHSGTLDPMATGLLVLGVGRGTRLLRFLGEFAKEYDGRARLGVETDTLDAEGTVVRQSDVPSGLSERDVGRAMAALTGEIDQRPPAYSAVKVGGEKLYRAARRGEEIEAAPRRVRVDSFELRSFDRPEFAFAVRCSSGTYVRSLVAEVGRALGCGAHLTLLRRTAIGPFRVSEARPPEDPGTPLSLDRAVSHLPAFALEAEEARVAAHGSVLAPAGIDGPYRAVGPDGRLIGIYRDQGPRSLPEVILAPA
jgi:tRNA pseudouridine55 synthase